MNVKYGLVPVAIVGPHGPQIRMVSKGEAKQLGKDRVLVPAIRKDATRSRLIEFSGHKAEPDKFAPLNASENGPLYQLLEGNRQPVGKPELRGAFC